jgi:hypothetical protein
MADDRGIRESAVERWLLTSAVTDPKEERNARALQARTAIGAIEGLAFFASEQERFTVSRAALEDPEWCEESASQIRDGIAMANAMPKHLLGEPVGFSPEDQALLADLLRLDDRKRALFAEMFEHARRRWENEVQPVVAAMSPERLYRAASGTEAIRACIQARAAATAIDQEIAASVAAVLDAPDAGPILEWYRVSRLASTSLGAGRERGAPPAPAVLLRGPLSIDGRRAAILAASDALASFRAADEESNAAESEREALMSEMREGRERDSAGFRRLDSLQARTDAAATACSQAEAALRSAIAPALQGQDAARWSALSAWGAEPAIYADPAALWNEVARILECLGDAERPTLEPRVAAIEARCTEALRTLGDRTVAMAERVHQPARNLAPHLLRRGIESVGSSLIVLLAPERCAPRSVWPTSYFRLGPALARLRANCDAAVAAPPTPAP